MINLRSPYYVISNTTNLTRVDMEIYIYTGTQTTDRPASAQYTLASTAYDEESVVDISELARDYIESTFSGTYSSTCVWIDYRTNEYISGVAGGYGSYTQLAGFDGYRYFEDGVQSDAATYTAPDLLQSNTLILKHQDDIVRVPVLQDNNPTVTFLYKGKTVSSTTITSTSESTDIIRYVKNTGASQDDFKARVEADGGTYEPEAVGRVFLNYAVSPCDTITIDDGSTVTKLTVKDIEECKYTPYKLTFVNKFGALQDIWMFKKSEVSMSVSESRYKSNIVTSGSYNTYSHQQKVIRKLGNERMSLNSGIYPEEYNEVFRQLLLSELVWIKYNGDTLPVTITSSDFDFKTSVNDRSNSYTINLEFAHEKINSIR